MRRESRVRQVLEDAPSSFLKSINYLIIFILIYPRILAQPTWLRSLFSAPSASSAVKSLRRPSSRLFHRLQARSPCESMQAGPPTMKIGGGTRRRRNEDRRDRHDQQRADREKRPKATSFATDENQRRSRATTGPNQHRQNQNASRCRHPKTFLEILGRICEDHAMFSRVEKTARKAT